MRLDAGDGRQVVDRSSVTFMPQAESMRVEDGTWLRLGGDAVAIVRGLARDVEPFPAARLRLPGPPTRTPAAPAARAGDPGGPPGRLVALGAAMLVAAAATVPRVRARRA